MNISNYIAALIVASMTISMASGFPKAFVDNRIKVSNATEKKIAKVLVSSDGENYTAVNMPNGIKPRQTVQINWQRRTSDCHWTLKAQYADRSESAPTSVNVCQSDVTVEFN
jgi:hypothetical protein